MNELRHLNKKVWKKPFYWLAFGLGSGLLPKAPGTFGTLVAIPFYWFLSSLSWPYYLSVVLFLMIVSCYICHVVSQDLGVHDYKGIVLDEMIGYWVTMTAFPPTFFWIVCGFLWFRLFDIWKPWPISWVQNKVKGGVGIVLDDVLAGVFAWLALYLTNSMFF